MVNLVNDILLVCEFDACVWVFGVFFFKQKTAYEMLRSLVGSEMCIRDSVHAVRGDENAIRKLESEFRTESGLDHPDLVGLSSCLLYTSDAADDLLCVDLGGRRIIKKKNNATNTPANSTYSTITPEMPPTRRHTYRTQKLEI